MRLIDMNRIMQERNTLSALRIKEPIPVPGLGTLFWQKAYIARSCPAEYRNKPDDWERAGYPGNSTTHYSIPSPSEYPFLQDFSLILMMDEPVRRRGSELVTVHVDGIMERIEFSYSLDGKEKPNCEHLRLPARVIKALENLLVELDGVNLRCYNGRIDDEDPRNVLIDFEGCNTGTVQQDSLLITIAFILAQEFQRR